MPALGVHRAIRPDWHTPVVGQILRTISRVTVTHGASCNRHTGLEINEKMGEERDTVGTRLEQAASRIFLERILHKSLCLDF